MELFFFNDTATTEIYTLSLHDALPIYSGIVGPDGEFIAGPLHKEQGILYAELDPRQMRGPKWNLDVAGHYARPEDRKSTRLNSSHANISYAVFCLKKKNIDSYIFHTLH